MFFGLILMIWGLFLEFNQGTGRYFLTDHILVYFDEKDTDDENSNISKIAYGVSDVIDIRQVSLIATEVERLEVYDGMTIKELGAKLDRSLKGVLAGKGLYIAEKAIELEIDPYVATAIMLHETGCKWTCSRLARVNHNVGGMKGRNGWQKFPTINAGIDAFMNNLYKNYYSIGLNTPEKMSNKYADGSQSWAGKVDNYIVEIRNK